MALQSRRWEECNRLTTPQFSESDLYKVKSIAFKPTDSVEPFRDATGPLESGLVWKEVEVYVIKLTFDPSGPWKVWVKHRESDSSLDFKVDLEGLGQAFLSNAEFRKMQPHGWRGAFLAELTTTTGDIYDTDAIFLESSD